MSVPTQLPQTKLSIDPQSVMQMARQVIDIEARAVVNLADTIDASFVKAVELLLNCQGRVVIIGMGKSGHIARKIAATMASTGTPAFFVHPGEAAHGDLGMITPQDVALLLSYSGESDEVLVLLPALKRKGVPLIAMTGKPQSTLAREADVHLNSAVAEEACPLGLAPTASTTAALVLGDALAVSLLETRGFGPEDFAVSHPAGRLGRRLLVHVRDVMHAAEELPKVQSGVSLKEALLEMSAKGLGMTAIVGQNNALLGLFTDGDLRRALDRNIDLLGASVNDVMTQNPKTIDQDRLAAEAVQILEAKRINGLLVVNAEGALVGALNMHDLMRAGVV